MVRREILALLGPCPRLGDRPAEVLSLAMPGPENWMGTSLSHDQTLCPVPSDDRAYARPLHDVVRAAEGRGELNQVVDHHVVVVLVELNPVTLLTSLTHQVKPSCNSSSGVRQPSL
jgi:hypothetical protein